MIKITIFAFVLFFSVTLVFTKPSMNSSSGCSGSGCHSFSSGIVSADVISESEIQVMVTGVSSNKDVAGELVDSDGNVVDYINATKTNPFVLTAPGPGTYKINAGYKNPNREWDSTSVNFVVTGLLENPHVQARDFQVYANYPNPFNPSTSISFYVPEKQHVEIQIFDVLGQKIETLLSGDVTPGLHTYRWHANYVSSGVYFYKVSAGTQVKINKMVLTR